MAATPSTMLALGTKAPDFSLTDVVTGRNVSLDDFSSSKALLVMFICKHCPYVIHIEKELAKLGTDYLPEDVGIVAICANDIENYPQDAPEQLKAMAERLGFTFPYLIDETQEVAKAYSAACTPDFFLFDGDRKLVYRGQLDGSRPRNDVPVSGADLRAAIDAVLAHTPVDRDQLPSIGCNIKWRPGNEPSYVGT
ncbi:MAG: thioredoxin family protein [Trueperaceae bacterium]|nr:MAG: thioredoxin family protein [Trueperaceae bacterium]